ncbi:NADP-dependent malic enzyme [Nannocystis sp. SCPEA4]|uniref:NADP-dependent malic enzyme n=1 Tax=Nannocystis sp. SCPEA4 TaxID=2996787 RepID=UPI002270DEA6|nr:NADP-dependent malic enzyme [Nannocystis sp. SCPEA4]MCY1055940.1 NADP-dependent malic enzyme [Nannocystis sp. SCPEA4]
MSNPRSQRGKDALEFHAKGRPGKIQVVPTKPLTTQRDLSLAYSPGVAEPCMEIFKDPAEVYKYTARGNLVAVISDGTAVLGLGDIGPLASKPVMEGKGVLFKKFADIDVFDLEVKATSPDQFIECVAALEPTFGGINLEDIKAPECFYIEEKLKQRMNIPVFHDDQHGTAIISGAALLNAVEIQKKSIGELKVVVSGAGASAIACAKFYVSLGVKLENILMCDSKGVLSTKRKFEAGDPKLEFVRDVAAVTMADAMVGADLMLGLSRAGLVTPEMLQTMAPRPIIFALANPDPEIDYPTAKETRPDAIVATGRSDYNNQVNNVLGFPFIFRGALDVRATQINEAMKVAAAHALAELARKDVPQVVNAAYGEEFHFGPEYIIPKPFDPRVLHWVAPAVAKAAMETGVAQIQLELDAYRERLQGLLGGSTAVMRKFVRMAAGAPKKVVFPEGDDPRILKACSIITEERIARPILLGDPQRIEKLIRDQDIDLLEGSYEIVDPREDPAASAYAEILHRRRERKGVTAELSRLLMRERNHFGMMMVAERRVDGIVTGLNFSYSDTIRPALQIIGIRPGARRICGMYLMLHKGGMLFFGDTTVNLDYDATTLADVAEMVAEAARTFGVTPRVAMLSFSNFGSVRDARSTMVADATALLRRRRPDLEVEGEMQANVAVDYALMQSIFPSTQLTGPANVLIFPNLEAGNVAYKLMRELGGVPAVGPVLLGMARPVTVLERDCSVDNIVHMTALTVVAAQKEEADAGGGGPQLV